MIYSIKLIKTNIEIKYKLSCRISKINVIKIFFINSIIIKAIIRYIFGSRFYLDLLNRSSFLFGEIIFIIVADNYNRYIYITNTL